MKIRDFEDIFPSYYVNPPEEYLVRRHCDAHLTNSSMPRDAYEWIERKTNPYEREAYASVTYHLISEHCVEDGWRLDYCVREEIEDHLKNIIRHAQTEEMAEEMLNSEGISSGNTFVTQNSTPFGESFGRLQDQVKYITSEVKAIKAQLAPKSKSAVIVSEIFTQEPVKACLTKLQSAGILDANLQPVKLSRTDKAILAFCISDKCFGSAKWKPFEDLWQVKNMRIIYNKALELIKTSELLEKYKNIIN